MSKSKRKKQKGTPAAKEAKKEGKNPKGQTKVAKYVSHLLELHKLQGVLLTRLSKEVR